MKRTLSLLLTAALALLALVLSLTPAAAGRRRPLPEIPLPLHRAAVPASRKISASRMAPSLNREMSARAAAEFPTLWFCPDPPALGRPK